MMDANYAQLALISSQHLGFIEHCSLLYGPLDTGTLNHAYWATADQTTLTPMFNMQDAPLVKLI